MFVQWKFRVVTYSQRGHKKARCPSLFLAGQVMAPAPATLTITDGRQGRAEAPAVGGRAFQMTTMETRATSNVAGVYLLFLC